ncbi:unnamed protein product [Paramecium sonneborni]|uniref:Transmembrane protein n=1 Tax=Paramecium sonneborni TaxID=65129 RepID=A0A8S1PWR2_9CILI|nr:unnamed protein product [Paramecium sonneborni]
MIKLIIIVYSLIIFVKGQQICPEDEYNFKNQCIAKSCQKYIEKITSKKKPSGKRFLSLDMKGKVVKKQQQYGIEIEFNDEIDGVFNRDNNESCIKDELYRYEMNYVHETKDDSQMNSSYVEKKRKWSFWISNWDSILYQDKQSDKSIYNGFYTIDYFVKNYLILQYMFDFQIVIDNSNNLIETHFNDQILDDQVSCNILGECIKKIVTEIRFCNDTDCQIIQEMSNFTMNRPVYLMSLITEAGFQDWYSHDYELTFKSNQLVKRFKPMSEKQSPGQTILQLSLPFIADKGELYMSSKLSNTKFIGRVLENEIGSGLAISIQQEIPCIKLSGQDQCPSQEQINQVNKVDCGSVDILYCDWIIQLSVLIVLILIII